VCGLLWLQCEKAIINLCGLLWLQAEKQKKKQHKPYSLWQLQVRKNKTAVTCQVKQ